MNNLFKQWDELTTKLVAEPRIFNRKEDESAMLFLLAKLSSIQGSLRLLTEEDYEEVGNDGTV
jgi:hypothetical protein